jgi:hypothetical protein
LPLIDLPRQRDLDRLAHRERRSSWRRKTERESAFRRHEHTRPTDGADRLSPAAVIQPDVCTDSDQPFKRAIATEPHRMNNRRIIEGIGLAAATAPDAAATSRAC